MVDISLQSFVPSRLFRGVWRLAVALAAMPTPLIAQDEINSTDLYRYEVTEVVTDVYVLHSTLNRGGFANSNIAVIIEEDGVLAVDSGFLPAAAQVAISEIKRLTDAPVRYVVNTHWHADHWQGNEAFADAYPGVTFVAVESGRAEIADRGVSDAAYFAGKFRDDADAIRGKIETKTDTDGSILDPETIEQLRDWLPLKEFAASQLATLRPTLPTLTFDRRLILRLGSREVHVLFLGLGNTKGDAVVYLPEEKLIITGDLVVHPSPFESGSFSPEWRDTLSRLASMDIEYLIPGHGAVQTDMTYVETLINIFDVIIAEVEQAISSGLDLEETKGRVTFEVIGGHFAGDHHWNESPTMKYFVNAGVERMHERLSIPKK